MNTELFNRAPYRWRKLSPKQREELLRWRVESHHPWHRPPHRTGEGNCCYHVTAACYVERWQDWPFSSAANYLHELGHEEAVNIWEAYPVSNYGEGWDDAKL